MILWFEVLTSRSLKLCEENECRPKVGFFPQPLRPLTLNTLAVKQLVNRVSSSLSSSRCRYSQRAGGHVPAARGGAKGARPGAEAAQTHRPPPGDLRMTWADLSRK